MVQSDKTLLLEIDHPDADACRMAIAPFAELERAPEHIHTYRLTPLGLWNARAAGHDAEQVVDTLLTYSRYPVPSSLLVDVADTMDRFGRLRLEKHPTARPGAGQHRPGGADRGAAHRAKVKGLVGARLDDDTVAVHPSERGHLKQVLLKLGWPAEDLAGYVDGEAHEIALDAERLGAAAVPAAGRRFLLARRIRRGRAALRGRQDRGRGGCDGARPGHHVDLGHQHRRRPASGATSCCAGPR